MEEIIAGLLKYSFDEIEWEWDVLTPKEQEIIGSAENLKQLEERYRYSV